MTVVEPESRQLAPIGRLARRFRDWRKTKPSPKTIRGEVPAALKADATQVVRNADQVADKRRPVAVPAARGGDAKVGDCRLVSDDAVKEVAHARRGVERDEDVPPP